MTEPIYGRVWHFSLPPDKTTQDIKLYQMQSVDSAEGVSFIIKHSGEYLCTISMNDQNDWISDNEISDDILTLIVQEIKKRYE